MLKIKSFYNISLFIYHSTNPLADTIEILPHNKLNIFIPCEFYMEVSHSFRYNDS